MNDPRITPPFLDAPWPDAPRHGPDAPLPPYRFVPGLSSHPVTHPDGHRYGQGAPEAPPPGTPWQENAAFGRGFDLYHAGYYWEAHEYWEAVWISGLEPSGRAVVQALILNAAAQLKTLTGNSRGAALLSAKALRRLEGVNTGRLLGVDIDAFRIGLEAQDPLEPPASPPRFRLG